MFTQCIWWPTCSVVMYRRFVTKAKTWFCREGEWFVLILLSLLIMMTLVYIWQNHHSVIKCHWSIIAISVYDVWVLQRLQYSKTPDEWQSWQETTAKTAFFVKLVFLFPYKSTSHKVLRDYAWNTRYGWVLKQINTSRNCCRLQTWPNPLINVSTRGRYQLAMTSTQPRSPLTVYCCWWGLQQDRCSSLTQSKRK